MQVRKHFLDRQKAHTKRAAQVFRKQTNKEPGSTTNVAMEDCECASKESMNKLTMPGAIPKDFCDILNFFDTF